VSDLDAWSVFIVSKMGMYFSHLAIVFKKNTLHGIKQNFQKFVQVASFPLSVDVHIHRDRAHELLDTVTMGQRLEQSLVLFCFLGNNRTATIDGK
jgi:hypothetical protein